MFAKGLADSGCWGDKLFGRPGGEELRGGGHGCSLRRGLPRPRSSTGWNPSSGQAARASSRCPSLLVFGLSSETSLLGRNYDVTIQVLSHAPAPASTLSFPPSQPGPVGKPHMERIPSQSPLYLDESLRCSPGHIFRTIVFKLYFSAETFFTSLNCILHRSLICEGTGG